MHKLLFYIGDLMNIDDPDEWIGTISLFFLFLLLSASRLLPGLVLVLNVLDGVVEPNELLFLNRIKYTFRCFSKSLFFSLR